MYYLSWNAREDIKRSGTTDFNKAVAMAEVMSRATEDHNAAVIAVMDMNDNVIELIYNGIRYKPET